MPPIKEPSYQSTLPLRKQPSTASTGENGKLQHPTFISLPPPSLRASLLSALTPPSTTPPAIVRALEANSELITPETSCTDLLSAQLSYANSPALSPIDKGLGDANAPSSPAVSNMDEGGEKRARTPADSRRQSRQDFSYATPPYEPSVSTDHTKYVSFPAPELFEQMQSAEQQVKGA
ncbi:hypothetical protein G7K_0126-t1 [Saitoella complicata NRRL Y-17804]|uniref:Uncharacterized protein n=2 Tax=Saitoella complicata (strain BCRC 22490 / CBS 7301 / JCM 7358 / NBRC 10748 / NRRL Y-17804) TaxID=698492 RepID=A0A0E9N915_SAICN|nr:hypothetical protein G7K_0126-t1 [Saitoella complicata NRRL Y-17804]